MLFTYHLHFAWFPRAILSHELYHIINCVNTFFSCALVYFFIHNKWTQLTQRLRHINLRKLNLIRLLKGRISNSRKIRLCNHPIHNNEHRRRACVRIYLYITVTQETTILNHIDDSRYVPIKIGNFEWILIYYLNTIMQVMANILPPPGAQLPPSQGPRGG